MTVNSLACLAILCWMAVLSQLCPAHAQPVEARVTIRGLGTFGFDGLSHAVMVETRPEGLPVAITYNGNSEEPVEAGVYLVNVTIEHEEYTGEASGTLTIEAVERDTFWKELKTPPGAVILSTYQSENGTLFAGTGDGAIVRRLKGKTSWSVVHHEVGNNTLALTEHNGTLFAGYSEKVLTSTDNGDSWTTMSDGLAAADVRDILFTDGIVHLATSRGLMTLSTGDGGSLRWVVVPALTEFLYCLYRSHDNVLYAGGIFSLHRSFDNGATWQPASPAFTAITSIAEDLDGNLYVGCNEGVKLHRPAADIMEWESVAEDITSNDQAWVAVEGNRLFISNIYVTQTGPAAALFFSDNQTEWHRMNTNGVACGRLFTIPGTDQIGFGTNNGIWTCINAPLGVTDERAIGLPQSVDYITASQEEVFMASSIVNFYQAEHHSDIWADYFGGDHVIVLAYHEALSGEKLLAIRSGWTGRPSLSAFLKIDSDEFRWHQMSFESNVQGINDVLMTRTGKALIATQFGLYTIDRKEFRLAFASPIGDVPLEIADLLITAGGMIYAATNNGVYRSDDEGRTWQAVALQETAITCLEAKESDVLIGTQSGMYLWSVSDQHVAPIGDFKAVYSILGDMHGNYYAVARRSGENRKVFTASGENLEWHLENSGLEGLESRLLLLVQNEVLVSTSLGLYKHQYARTANVELFGLGEYDYDGTLRNATVATEPSLLNVSLTYNGESAAPVNPGAYEVVATVDEAEYVGQARGLIKINPLSAQVTLSGAGRFVYDGVSHGVTATTVPTDLHVTMRYNNELTAPVNAGSYTVFAEITHPLYYGTATATLVIDKADQQLSIEPVRVHYTSDAPFPLHGVSTSNLPVSYQYVSGPAMLTVDEENRQTLVVLTGEPGRVLLYARQPGNHNYWPADVVEIDFDVMVVMSADESGSDALYVYPVPAVESVVVSSDEVILALELFDASGRAMGLYRECNTLDVSEFAEGLYLLCVTTRTGRRYFRLPVSR